ncbi:MAG: 3-dehydroquinate synthase [Gammaproteobacteria bacterium]|nr:3-dehydroquinate synthase [Gammaproteobacteria bacterium]
MVSLDGQTLIPSLSLDLPDGRTSEIYIGSGYLGDPRLSAAIALNTRVAAISNERVASLYGDIVDRLAPNHETILIGDGEQYKSLETYSEVIDQLIEHRFNRDGAIIALGGGVVGDLAGFVAATYQRGVRLVQIPTTLLAQVDSAIGGKTAVNHSTGKNLIGAFYQPETVLIDTDVLSSLPDHVFIEGLAEVIKYGVIYDAAFFEWLEDNTQSVLAREPEALQFIVRRSCEIKAEVVASDEREQNQRAILNFGHTVAHALEAETQYGELRHGQAVSIGMVMESDLACRENLCDTQTAQRIRNIVEAYRLPHTAPEVDVARLLDSMAMDKKVVEGELRFVLPRAIGSVVVTGGFDQENLEATLNT